MCRAHAASSPVRAEQGYLFAPCQRQLFADAGITLDFVPIEDVAVRYECVACGESFAHDAGEYRDVVDDCGYTEKQFVCEACRSDYDECHDCNHLVHDDDTCEATRRVRREPHGWPRRTSVTVCPSCRDDDYSECEACGGLFHEDLVRHSDGGDHYCEGCFSERYTACCDCGRELQRDDDDHYTEDGDGPYCWSCLPAEADEDVMCYSTDVLDHCSFLGHARDGIYLGIENEVEGTEVSETLDLLGRDYAIAKSDSSIGDYEGGSDGFEIVTAPATVEVHKERWSRFIARKPYSINAGKNGLHVHVSRKPLGELAVGKVVNFVNNPDHAREVTLMAGRGPVHWCKRIEKSVGEYKSQCYDKYQAVNLSHADTVEFRIFNATTNRDRLFARVEFVAALCRWAKYHAGVRDLTWARFAEHVAARRKDYPDLYRYMADKGIAHRPEPALA